MAAWSFQQAKTAWSPLTPLYILWLSVKDVSKLPRCWSRTCIPPALLRSTGIVWDFRSAATCLDNQASCTLQGEVKAVEWDKEQKPHHYRITRGTWMDTWPPSHKLKCLIPANPRTDQATLVPPATNGLRANETAELLLRELRRSCDLCLTCSRLWGTLQTCAGIQECLGLVASCRSWRGRKGHGAKRSTVLCSLHDTQQSPSPDPAGFLLAWVCLTWVCMLPSCLCCGREHEEGPLTLAPDGRIQYLAIFLFPTYLKWNKHTLERKKERKKKVCYRSCRSGKTKPFQIYSSHVCCMRVWGLYLCITRPHTLVFWTQCCTHVSHPSVPPRRGRLCCAVSQAPLWVVGHPLHSLHWAQGTATSPCSLHRHLLLRGRKIISLYPARHL